MKISQVLKKVYGEEEYRARMSKCWRETRRGGRPVLVSPEGRVYYGTAAEVREAGLAPHRRKSLLDGLRCMHLAHICGTINREELRVYCAARRRDAIREGVYDRHTKHWAGEFPLRDLLRVRAAARSAGVDCGAFVERLVLAAVADAEARCGGRLPFTRHEAAALALC